MSKTRLFELASRLGHTPEELRDELAKRGSSVKSNLSLLEQPQIDELTSIFAAKDPKAGAKVGASPGAAKPVLRVGGAPAIKPVGKGTVRIRPVAPKKEEELEVVIAPVVVPPAPEHASATVSFELPPPPPKPVLAPRPEPKAPTVEAQPPRARVPRPLTTVSFEIPKYDRPPVPVKKEKTAPRTVEITYKDQPRMGGPASAPSAGSGTRRDKKKKKDKEDELEAKIFGKQKPGFKPVEVTPPPEPLPEGPKKLSVPEGVSVSELAQAMAIKATDIIRKLMMDYKVMATVNQKLPKDVIETIAIDFGYELTWEGLYGEELLEQEEKGEPADLTPRAPVVTIMGHVDHGKTSLLDAIRSTNVVAGESGGITQHIGAYKVHLEAHEGFAGGDVVFLDTPGHAAFTAMRARGAKMTDIVVLVVAADDSVMPQTIEAIAHAKEAGVPIVVAINKIDKEGANPDRVMQELSGHGLVPEAWGGSTIMVKLSAKKKQGVKELIELLALQSEILELKADAKRRAKGTVIEAKLDKGRGAVATVLVQKGTLRVGDMLVMGSHSGRVRAMHNERGDKLEEAGPSTPVEVLGMSGVPMSGDGFQSLADERLARQVAGKRLQAQQDRERLERGHVKLEDLFDRIEAGEMKELKIVIKADVSGSVEALKHSLEEIKSDKVRARVILGSVGNINENDVLLAAASDAIVIGFHVKAANSAVELAHREKVEVRMYQVIYEAVNDVRDAMVGLLEPHYNEVVVGKGEVRQIFRIAKGFIAGSIITDGKIHRDSTVRIYRGKDREKIYEGKLVSLKRFKDDAREVLAPNDCGIGLDPTCKVLEGDVFEVLTMEEVAQKL